MRRSRLGLLSTLILAAMVVTGCKDSAADPPASAGGSTAATASASAGGAASSGAAAAGDDTKTACATVNADITGTLAKVTEAEKIGPPAGFNAVSAQYSAGAAVLYSHAFNTSTKVNDAAKKVGDAMSGLADAWAKNPKDKPSTAALTTAVGELKTVCG
jgi:hypothetical protein